MLVKKAASFFVGSGGQPRLNCRQAIASAFREKFGLSDEFIAGLVFSGFGQAPGGVCGALYSVQIILRHAGNNNGEGAVREFSDYTGAPYCEDIRRLKKISCIECVKKAARILDAAKF